MSKQQGLMVLGALVFIQGIFPNLGFPGVYGAAVSMILGVLIIVVAYKSRTKKAIDVPSSAVPFSESKSTPNDQPTV